MKMKESQFLLIKEQLKKLTAKGVLFTSISWKASM